MKRRKVSRGEVVWHGAARRAARDKLSADLHKAKHRLHPKTLLEEARDDAKQKALEAALAAARPVARRPRLVAGAGAIALIVLLRKPLARLIGRKGNKRPAKPL